MASDEYSIHQAQTDLSRLVEEASQGKEIVICRAGKPLARLVPLAETNTEDRKPGGLEGKIWVSDDFDHTPDEIIDAFEGNA